MSITHKPNLALGSSVGSTISGTYQEVGSAEAVIDTTVPISSTNLLFTVAITAANIQSLMLISSTDLTIKTNSTSTPGNTISLKAGIPLFWSKSPGYFTSPITVDVTAFYYTNGAAATTLKGRILTT